MWTPSTLRRTRPLPALVLAALASACATGPEESRDVAAASAVNASPASVAAHMVAADQNRDYGSLLDVMAPHYRTTFVWAAWFGAAYEAIGGDAATVEAYEAINARHGLDPEWLNRTSPDPVGRVGLAALADEAFADVDLAALLGDLLRMTVGDETFFGTPGSDDGAVALDGDRALAQVGSGEHVLRRLEDGGWYWFPKGSED